MLHLAACLRRRALQTFLSLLDIDYDAGFRCPCCCKLSPEAMVVIGDGKVMGYKKAYARQAHPIRSDRVVPDL